jgi:hypothetical protein
MAIKVSLKVKKIFCYLGMNLGVLVFSAIEFLQGTSVKWSLVILLGSLVWINFLVWFMFRMLGMRGHDTSAPGPQEKQ